jgi:hypothetical protein
MSPSQGLALALQELRAKAVTRRIDLTRCLEEALGSGQEKELGIMQKSTFKTVMSALFGHAPLTMASIDMICDTWAAGDPGAPGGCKYVRCKHFLADFHSIPPPELGQAPSRHFASAMNSDVFYQKPFGRPERREGRQPHGDLRSASEVHFGGPEAVLPVASVPHGRSEEITRSSLLIRGPDGVTEEEIQSHAREAAARRPFASMRNQTTVAEVKPPKVASPTKQKMERGSVEFSDEPIGRAPAGFFYDKDNQLRPYTCWSGAQQHSTIHDKLKWEDHDDGSPPINEHTLRGRRTYFHEDSRASKSVMRNVISMRGDVPASAVLKEFPGTRQHFPEMMFKSTIQGEAMSWNPPDNLPSPSHRRLPSGLALPSQPQTQPALSPQPQHHEPYALPQQYAPQELYSPQKVYAQQQAYSPQQHYREYAPTGDATWGQMDVQGSLRAGGAPAQSVRYHPHGPPSAMEQQYIHLQQHMREQLQPQ